MLSITVIFLPFHYFYPHLARNSKTRTYNKPSQKFSKSLSLRLTALYFIGLWTLTIGPPSIWEAMAGEMSTRSLGQSHIQTCLTYVNSSAIIIYSVSLGWYSRLSPHSLPPDPCLESRILTSPSFPFQPLFMPARNSIDTILT